MLVPGQPIEHHESTKVFPPFPPPQLYQTSKGKVGAFLIDDAEVDALRIQAIRRCTCVLDDLGKLQQEPAKLSHVLGGVEAMRKLLLERVDFDAAEAIEKAMDRLESILGSDALVHDPRPEYGGHISLADARAQVDALTTAMKPYRAMRDSLMK